MFFFHLCVSLFLFSIVSQRKTSSEYSFFLFIIQIEMWLIDKHPGLRLWVLSWAFFFLACDLIVMLLKLRLPFTLFCFWCSCLWWSAAALFGSNCSGRGGWSHCLGSGPWLFPCLPLWFWWCGRSCSACWFLGGSASLSATCAIAAAALRTSPRRAPLFFHFLRPSLSSPQHLSFFDARL